MTTNTSRKWITGGIGSLFGGIILVGAWILFVGPSAELGRQQAAPLIAALEQYYSENGYYPETTDGLVPTYLSRVPDSGWGKALVYIPCSDGQDYTLTFYRGPALTPTYWGYTNGIDQWICAEAAPPFYENSPCGGRTPAPPRFPC